MEEEGEESKKKKEGQEGQKWKRKILRVKLWFTNKHGKVVLDSKKLMEFILIMHA